MPKLKETQPQVIQSPRQEMQILNHHIYYDRFGCACVEGGVKNLTSGSAVAKIKIDYFDLDGEYIDSEVQELKHRYPGKAIGFHVMYSGRRRLEVRSYQISIDC